MREGTFSIDVLGEKYPTLYIKDRTTAIKAIEQYDKQDCLFGFDFETQSLPKYKHIPKAATYPQYSIPRLAQLSNGKSILVLDFNHIGEPDFLVEFMKRHKFVAHWAVFELNFLRNMGVHDIDMNCTLLMATMIFQAARPNLKGLALNLESLVDGFLKFKIPKEAQKSDWSVPDLTYEQVHYAAVDAIIVLKLAEVLAQGLKNHNLLKPYKLVKKCQIPITTMKMTGIGFDIDKHNKMLHLWREQLYECKKEVIKITGLSKVTNQTMSDWLLSKLDTKTLRYWPRTEGKGILKTDAHTLADFSYLDFVAPFAAMQKYKKLSSGYGVSLRSKVNEATGRLHPNFKLEGAATGRMSCAVPNLQNAPNDYDFRSLFLPAKGKVLYSADYSQIELRVLAELSMDDAMLQAFRDGKDIHKITAAKVSGLPYDQITDEQRKAGKGFNFGLVFGMAAGTYVHYAKKSYGADIALEQAEEDIDKWRELYDDVYEWQMLQHENAKRTLKAITPYGKVRKLAHDNTYGAAMNTPVQGGAAECIKVAIILIDREIRKHKLDAHPVLCVHDDVTVEGRLEDKKILRPLIKNCMVKAFSHILPGAVLNGVVDEVGVGKNWAISSGKKPNT